jgi:hypothetical protein
LGEAIFRGLESETNFERLQSCGMIKECYCYVYYVNITNEWKNEAKVIVKDNFAEENVTPRLLRTAATTVVREGEKLKEHRECGKETRK